MRIGLTTAHERISPVCDCAHYLSVYDIDQGIAGECSIVSFDCQSYVQKVTILEQMKVEYLICGALSREFQSMISATGIQVIPWISGPVNEVISAFCAGSLEDIKYMMPGCCRRMHRRGRRRSLNNNKEVS